MWLDMAFGVCFLCFYRIGNIDQFTQKFFVEGFAFLQEGIPVFFCEVTLVVEKGCELIWGHIEFIQEGFHIAVKGFNPDGELFD